MGKIYMSRRLLALACILVFFTSGKPVSGQDTTYGALLLEGPELVEGLPGSKVWFQVRVFYEGPDILAGQISMRATSLSITDSIIPGFPMNVMGGCFAFSIGPPDAPGLIASLIIEATIPENGCSSGIIFFTDSCTLGGGVAFRNIVVDPMGNDKVPSFSELEVGVCSIYPFLRGDCNGDGDLDISDAIHNLFYQFLGGSLNCVDAADVDDNNETEVTDVIYLLRYLFLGAPEPVQPFPECGPDLTTDKLTCESYQACQEQWPPTANAGGDQTVDALTLVTLTGTGSDSDGIVEAYQWEQIPAPTVMLTDDDQATATFDAPDVTEPTVLSFRLTVIDDKNKTGTDIVEITVEPVAEAIAFVSSLETPVYARPESGINVFLPTKQLI